MTLTLSRNDISFTPCSVNFNEVTVVLLALVNFLLKVIDNISEMRMRLSL